MEKSRDKSPWVDVRAIRWSDTGQLLVQGPDNDDFIPIRQYFAARPELADFVPINTEGCGFGPINNNCPMPPTPDGFCATLPALQVRSRVDGLDVKTEMGVKSLDELIRLEDREADR